MAREDVNIKVSANVAEAIRLWKAMEEGPEGMAREIDGLAATGKRGAQGMAAEFDKLVGKLTAVQLAIGAAKKVFDEFQQLRQQDLERRGRAFDSVDAEARRFYVQQGGTGDYDAFRQKILDIAVTRSVSPQQAYASATQLVSSGFSADQVLEGGVLDQYLKTLAATNQTGQQVDAAELAKAMSLFLNATGQMNQQGMRGAGVATQNLFQGTNLQLSDMARFAPEAGVIRQMTGLQNEQLGILAQFLNNADIAKGATAFRAGAVALATAGAMPKKVQALAELGLTPEDVDFQGESFFDVQRRLTGALQNVPGQTRNRVMARLFGAEGMLFGTTLLTPDGVAQTEEYQRIAANGGSFDRAVQVSEGSLNARRNRENAREARAFYGEGYVDSELMRQVIINWIEESKSNDATKSLLKGVAGQTFDFSQWLTSDPEAAGRAAIRAAGGDQRTQDALVERARAESVDVRVEIVDQNAIAIPHKSEVMQRGKQ